MSAPAIISSGTAAGGPPVGGSGTSSPSTIPRWTGASTLGDSGLIDDGSQIYTTSRVLAVNTATTLGTGLIRFQVGSASALANYQGAQAGFMLPAGSGSWVEFCENSTNGTTFRISKDASTGVVLNANGKNMGFNASGYTTAVASSQMVLLTSGNVGIGTASPGAILHTLGTGTTTGIFATSSANAWMELRRSTSTTLGYIGTGSGLVTGGAAADLAFRCESGNLLFSTVATERARIDSAGRFFIGASTTPNVATVRSVVANAGSVYTLFQNTTANVGGAVGNPGSAGLQFWATSGALGAETYTLSFSSNATGLDVSTSGYGLKLPATPGNADTQTLDAYQENTWTPTLTAFDGTAPTATTARYTRIGRVVYFEVVLSATGAANFGSTWGNTKVSLPFAPANTIAIPINRNAIGSCGTTSGSDILLTTYAQNAETMRLTGFFSV